MIYKLEKYLNAGYSHLDAQRELGGIYRAAVEGNEAKKIVRVTNRGVITDVRVGLRIPSKGRVYGNN